MLCMFPTWLSHINWSMCLRRSFHIEAGHWSCSLSSPRPWKHMGPSSHTKQIKQVLLIGIGQVTRLSARMSSWKSSLEVPPAVPNCIGFTLELMWNLFSPCQHITSWWVHTFLIKLEGYRDANMPISIIHGFNLVQNLYSWTIAVNFRKWTIAP